MTHISIQSSYLKTWLYSEVMGEVCMQEQSLDIQVLWGLTVIID